MGLISVILLVVLILVGFQALVAVLGVGVGLVIALLPSMLVGYLAGHIMSGGGYGIISNVLLGLGGGIVGNILLNNMLNLDVGGGWVERIAVGVVGAVVLIWLGRVLGISEERKSH